MHHITWGSKRSNWVPQARHLASEPAALPLHMLKLSASRLAEGWARLHKELKVMILKIFRSPEEI
jgi:hypothetical protein